MYFIGKNTILALSSSLARAFFCFLFLLANEKSHSTQKIPPKALLARCYTGLTGKSLPAEHPMLKELLEKGVDPVELCSRFINDVHLGEDELITGNAEAKEVLNHLFNFHRTWFESDSLQGRVDSQNQYSELHDQSEGALYFTRALFDEDRDLSYVFTANQIPLAIREQNRNCIYNEQYFEDLEKINPNHGEARCPDVSEGTYTESIRRWKEIYSTPESRLLIEKGAMLGITTRTPERTIQIPPDKIRSHSANTGRHLGGGILGSNSFYALNTPVGFRVSSGPIRNSRRWVRNVYKTLTCRELPLVKHGKNGVNLNREKTERGTPWKLASSNISFRSSGIGCMECHATMEPLAGVTRNFWLFFTNGNMPTHLALHKTDDLSDYYRYCHEAPDQGSRYQKYAPYCYDQSYFDFIKDTKSETPFQEHPHAEAFRDTKPTGRLYYVNVHNKFINRKVTGIEETGQAFLENEDFYACMASRYYNHFTGSQVDINPFIIEELSESQSLKRDTVLKLGSSLKSSKNLKQLIVEIFNHPDFHSEEITR